MVEYKYDSLGAHAVSDAKRSGHGICNAYDDWMFCRVENNIFSSSEDPSKLIKILKVFKQWADILDQLKCCQLELKKF